MHVVPEKKSFIVVTRRSRMDFESLLNIPPDGYRVHSWNMWATDFSAEAYEFVVVFKLDTTEQDEEEADSRAEIRAMHRGMRD